MPWTVDLSKRSVRCYHSARISTLGIHPAEGDVVRSDMAICSEQRWYFQCTTDGVPRDSEHGHELGFSESFFHGAEQSVDVIDVVGVRAHRAEMACMAELMRSS